MALIGIFIIGRGLVVAASILEGDYLDNYQHIEPVRAVSMIGIDR
jgi:hypothetical protein